jgi:hypothetical protein
VFATNNDAAFFHESNTISCSHVARERSRLRAMAGRLPWRAKMSVPQELIDPPLLRERMSVGKGVVWATRNVLAERGAAWSVLIVIALALPLYAINYHEGAHPIAGFWLALVLGAIAAGACMGVMVASLLGRSRRLALQGIACQLRWGLPCLLLFGIVMPTMMLAWKHVVAPATNVEWLNAWYQNDWAGAWKPLAHVASIAVINLAMAPFAALALPALAVVGGSPAATVDWMKRHVHHKTYHAVVLGNVGIGLAMVAWVPWVGLLALPVMCLLLVRVFHYSFERRPGWPPEPQ